MRLVRLRTSSAADGLERTDGAVVAAALAGDGVAEGLGEAAVGARGEVAGGEELAGVGLTLKR